MADANELLDEINRNTHLALKYSAPAVPRHVARRRADVHSSSRAGAVAVGQHRAPPEPDRAPHASSAKREGDHRQSPLTRSSCTCRASRASPASRAPTARNGAPGQHPDRKPTSLPASVATPRRGWRGRRRDPRTPRALRDARSRRDEGQAGPRARPGKPGARARRALRRWRQGREGREGRHRPAGEIRGDLRTGRPAGPQGPSGLTKVQTVTATSANNDAPVKQVTATCPTAPAARRRLPMGADHRADRGCSLRSRRATAGSSKSTPSA